jgi:hypothetical protein
MLACWLAIEARSGSTPGAPAQAAPERNVNFSQEAHNRARRLGEFGSFQFVDIFPCAERSKESGASAKPFHLYPKHKGLRLCRYPRIPQFQWR